MYVERRADRRGSASHGRGGLTGGQEEGYVGDLGPFQSSGKQRNWLRQTDKSRGTKWGNLLLRSLYGSCFDGGHPFKRVSGDRVSTEMMASLEKGALAAIDRKEP
jgi:hypothetical protein